MVLLWKPTSLVNERSKEEGKPLLWDPRTDIREVFSARPDALDGLRGVSILMVVLFHCFFVLKVALPKAAFVDFLSGTPHLIRLIFNFDKAVDVFFVVSGYLIGTSLLRERLIHGSLRLWTYYQRRVFRILPLFWIALLLYGSLAWKGDWESLVVNFLFLENLVPSVTKLVPVGWSLSMEVQFYIFAPLLFLVPLSRIPRVLFVLLALSIIVRLSLLLVNPEFFTTAPLRYLSGEVSGSSLLETLYYPTWARVGPIILGLLIPFMAHRYYSWFSEKKGVLLSLAGLSLFVGMVFPTYHHEVVTSPRLQLIGLTIDRVLVGFAAATLILYWQLDEKASALSASRRLLGHRTFSVWGRLVYPTYLFHLPVVAIAFLVVFQTTRPASVEQADYIQALAMFPLSLVLMLPIALLIHVLIEKPFIRLGTRKRETKD